MTWKLLNFIMMFCLSSFLSSSFRFPSRKLSRKLIYTNPTLSQLYGLHLNANHMELPSSTTSSVSSSNNSVSINKQDFQSLLKGQLFLAPLTRGGNLPFRRLCADFGAEFTMSEMAYARFLYKGRSNSLIRKERALLKKSNNEKYYGFQIATNSADEVLKALELCYFTGTATWLDLNYGCPTYEASHRGLGAIQLKHPKKINKLLNIVMPQIKIPLTVKIRIGIDDKTINIEEILSICNDNNVAAVTVHGRTMEQRYSKPANWNLIHEMSSKYPNLPIIGNGDILTWYEANDRLFGGLTQTSESSTAGNNGCANASDRGVSAIMTGRGALIKPWIFKEFREQSEYEPSTEERVAIYYKLGTYFKEHFGDDEKGKKSAFYFFPWHFGFLCRYRPLPKSIFYELSKLTPLIQNSRLVDEKLRENKYLAPLNIDCGSIAVHDCNFPLETPLEKLLRCDSVDAHLAIATELWNSLSPEDAYQKLELLATNNLETFQNNRNNTQTNLANNRGHEVEDTMWSS